MGETDPNTLPGHFTTPKWASAKMPYQFWLLSWKLPEQKLSWLQRNCVTFCKCSFNLIFSARRRSCGKVIFSYVSVCPGGRGGSHVTMMHWNSLHRAHPTIPVHPPVPSSRHETPQPSEHDTWDLLLVTSGGNHWWTVQTFSVEGTHPPQQYWHLVAWSPKASGWYASY